MKAFIFMNHHIKEKDSKEPLIVVQWQGRQAYTNRVTINGKVEVCTGKLKEVKTHEVKAWLECEFADIRHIL